VPPADCWYARAEYLVWWLREGHLPPALTTSSFASQGLLGRSDTVVLYGDGTLRTRHDDRFVGTRLTLGWWLDPEHALALEGSAFFLERDSTYFKATSNGSTLLARPYLNALDGTPASEIIAGPAPDGLRSGGFNGYSRIELFGQELNLVAPLDDDGDWCLDLLAGVHCLQLRDRLDLTAVSKLLPDQAVLLGESDHFRVENRFYGGQAGLRARRVQGRWSLDLRGEVALGADTQEVRTFGDHLRQAPTQRVDAPFGLAVLPSNRGRFHRATFDAVSEVGVNVGFQLTSRLRLFAGYTFLSWANPIRASDQLDLAVNPVQLTTGQPAAPLRPAIPFKEDFFWAQGVNAGLELRW
jgi:hypothetical protein